MDQILSYVKPELLIVVVVLYFIGVMIKKSENISDKFIPMILGILGMLICGLYVFATSTVSGSHRRSISHASWWRIR